MTTSARPYPVRLTFPLGLLLGALLFTLGSALDAPPAHADELPGNSLHHLDVELLDQNGETTKLASYRGRPFLVTMVYASCPSACPMLITDMRRIEKALAEAVRKDLSVLVVSFDPEADTPAALMELAKKQKVDLGRWKLAAAPAEQAAELAAVLGVKYRRAGGGHWIHSSIISVVDGDGVIRGKWEGYLKTVDEPAGVVTKVVGEGQKAG